MAVWDQDAQNYGRRLNQPSVGSRAGSHMTRLNHCTNLRSPTGSFVLEITNIIFVWPGVVVSSKLLSLVLDEGSLWYLIRKTI